MGYFIAIFIALVLIVAFPVAALVIGIGIGLFYLFKKMYLNSDKGKEYIKKKEELKQKKAEEFMKHINDLGVYPTKILTNQYGYSSVYVDDDNRKILFRTLRGDYVVDYDSITDFELRVNDSSRYRYTLSTAITGRLGTESVVEDIIVYVYVDSLDTPVIEVRSLGDGSKHSVNSDVAYTGQKFADDLIAVLKYIKQDNNKNVIEDEKSEIEKQTELIKAQTAALNKQIKMLEKKKALEAELNANKSKKKTTKNTTKKTVKKNTKSKQKN